MKRIIKLTESQLRRIIKEQTTTNINKFPDWPNKAKHYDGETANLYSDPQNRDFVKQIRFDRIAVEYDGTIEIMASGESFPLRYHCNKPNVIFGFHFKDGSKKQKENFEFYSNKLTPKLQSDFCTKNSTGLSVPKGTYTSAKTQIANLAENKKPIRLTEADLADLVKRVMEEGDRFAYGTDAIRNLEKDMAPDEDVRLTDYTGELRGDVLKKKDYIIQWLRDIIHNEDWNRLGDVILYMKHRM